MGFPAELRKINRWLCYDLSNKIPLSPVNGVKAIDVTNPDNLSDSQTALITKETHSDIGIGFALGYGIMGIDFDHCIDEDGCVDSEIMNIIEEIGSYTEISHSGTGIHIICKGELPAAGNRGKIGDVNIEMYDQNRYFTMTGRVLNGYNKLRSGKKVVPKVQEKYCKRTEVTENITKECHICEDIPAQLEKAMKDPVFAAYYNGERPTGDESVDDMGFMQKIVFWFGRDMDTCIDIFMSSDYFDTKDDAHKRKAERADYLPRTYNTANSRTVATYFDKDAVVMIKNANGEYIPCTKYGFHDSGNAQRFTDMFGTLTRFNHTNERWYNWKGTHWSEDTTACVKRLFNDMLRSMTEEAMILPADTENEQEERKEYFKWINKSQSHRGKENALKEATALEPIACDSGSFDADTSLFNLSDGTLELDTLTLREHRPSDMLTQMSQTKLGTGTPHRWLQFIDEITCGDADLARYIQRCVGYSLTGDTSEQCMFFLYGMGANGKSTFLDIVTALLGDYAKNAEAKTLMMKSTDSSANSDIARLQSARFVTVVETNEQQALDESLVKHLTGGEVVTARYLYGHEFQFIPQFKIWIATNHKPIIRGTDLGIWRRVKLIPFLATFSDEQKDVNLKDKLLAELPDIFTWALDGLKDWKAGGLREPEIVTESVKDYQREMNSVGQFFDDCVVITNEPTDKLSAKELYTAYKQWATFHDYTIETQTKFGKRIKEYCPVKVKLSTGFVYRGVKMIDDFDDTYDDTVLDSYTSDGNNSNVVEITHNTK